MPYIDPDVNRDFLNLADSTSNSSRGLPLSNLLVAGAGMMQGRGACGVGSECMETRGRTSRRAMAVHWRVQENATMEMMLGEMSDRDASHGVGRIKVSRRTFEWRVIRGTTDYHAADSDWHWDGLVPIHAVRINEPGTGFDIAIRIRYPAEGGPPVCALECFALVLGAAFPSSEVAVPAGHLIRLRPKLCLIPNAEPGPRSIERVVQWILSAHFRPVRVSLSGLPWTGPG